MTSDETSGARLRALAVTTGVLTAVWVGVLIDGFRPGAVVPVLLPVLLAAAPFALPAERRPLADTVAAAVVTIAMVATFTDAGMHYLPMVLLLWATVIVPRRMRQPHGPVAVRLLHLAAGLLVALPGLVSIGGIDKEMISLTDAGVLYILLPIGLGAMCAFQLRVGYTAVALFGTVAMFAALLDGGFLFLAFWWFGGLYLTVGAVGRVASPLRKI
ncbi:MAG TPA: hypothetical protein VN408_15630, partial [Actinoplanes sp.]|nr:hypothetical protein [Actinoplanes sp.]